MSRLNDKEKGQLTYQPVLEYVQQKVQSPDYIEAVQNADVSYAAEYLGGTTWSNIFDIIERLKALIVIIENRYSGPYADHGTVLLTEKQKAYLAVLYNMDSMNTGIIGDELTEITFDLYKEALSGLPTAFYKAIISIYEDYQAGVYGHADLEVYPILLNMLDEWNDLVEFFRYTVISQIDGSKARSLTSDSEVVSELIDIEMNQIYALSNLNNQRSNVEDEIKNYKSNDSRYHDLFSKYTSLTQDCNNTRDKIINKAQLVNSVQDKIDMADETVGKLEYLVHMEYSDAVAGDIKEAIQAVLSTVDSDGTTKIGQSLLLTLNDFKADVSTKQEDKEAIANNEIKQKLSNDLMYSCHIQNEFVRPLARKIMDAESIPYAAEPIIDIVVNGLEKSNEQYKVLIGAYYVLNQNDASSTNGIIDTIEKKKEARYYYRVIAGIKSYETSATLTDSALDSIIQKAL